MRVNRVRATQARTALPGEGTGVLRGGDGYITRREIPFVGCACAPFLCPGYVVRGAHPTAVSTLLVVRKRWSRRRGTPMWVPGGWAATQGRPYTKRLSCAPF